MTEQNNSTRKYHLTRLKADATIIGGALLAVGVTLTGIVLLHDQLSAIKLVAGATLGLTVFLVALTTFGREVLRRLGRTDDHPVASRYPGSVFSAAFVTCLFLTAMVSRSQIESGIDYRAGLQQLERGEYQAAAESFSNYIELLPTRPAGYYYRGLARYRAGQLEQAFSDLQVAIDRQPRDWNTRLLYLGTLERLGRSAELKTELEAAEQLNPNARQELDTLLKSVNG
jgi:tetratricopeptide (TPR) repeat protein